MSWRDIQTAPVRASGTAGTVTVPEGASVLRIIALGASGATIQVFADAAVISVPSTSDYYALNYHHLAMIAPAPGSSAANTIVFTSTTSYLVEWVVRR